MNYSTLKTAILILMVLNGLFFCANIYVLGNTQAAIAMHDDLAPDAGPSIANAKVLICFFVGLCYLIAAWGMARDRNRLALVGIGGFVLFDGFYLIELILWGKSHPRVWFDFGIFGGISLVIGIFSWLQWEKRIIITEDE
jgi:hypothetical protein